MQTPAETAGREKALLIEMLGRYQAALTKLHASLEQRERAKGVARPSFQRAWAEGGEDFNALGNWLDVEIDKRVEQAGARQ